MAGSGALGVFDSGLGGLTVVREIRRLLPDRDIVFVGDSVHAPYGPRRTAEIQALSLGQARYLQDVHRCTALVIACNTATAAAAALLRTTFPTVPIVAMEPAVKPAAAATQSGIVGVLATVGTLQSARFAALLERYGGAVQFLTRSCSGWVEAVERGELFSEATRELIARDVCPLLEAGADTLVLGCTHFPALRELIAQVAGANVHLIDTGEAVARRVQGLTAPSLGTGQLSLYTTGECERFAVGAAALLGERNSVFPLYWKDGELLKYATY